ncbi:MAG: SgcJ/EcaC family oxidoreductase [Hyphomicrobiales bacterium]|nr:SgcJ/EcaC family oxidoreductase [Hyphomicrobiales bacterium]
MTTVRDSIEATIKTLVECLNGGDAAGVAAHYTNDAALLPPDAARIDGREGIQGVWQGLIDAHVRDVAMTTQEVDVFGNVANEVGTITATAPSKGGGRAQLAGKYVAVWKCGAEGNWQLHRDIWNFDA